MDSYKNRLTGGNKGMDKLLSVDKNVYNEMTIKLKGFFRVCDFGNMAII